VVWSKSIRSAVRANSKPGKIGWENNSESGSSNVVRERVGGTDWQVKLHVKTVSGEGVWQPTIKVRLLRGGIGRKKRERKKKHSRSNHTTTCRGWNRSEGDSNSSWSRQVRRRIRARLEADARKRCREIGRKGGIKRKTRAKGGSDGELNQQE